MSINSWPEIHLEAVNKTAAFLLHKSGADPAPIDKYVASIRADMEKIDRAIASISGQLQVRSDPDWAPSAKRALKDYYTQRNTLKKMLHAASEALLAIRVRIKENEKTMRMRELEAGSEQQRQVRAKERMERIDAANSVTQKTHVIFKRKVMEIIGRDRCVELLKQAAEEASL